MMSAAIGRAVGDETERTRCAAGTGIAGRNLMEDVYWRTRRRIGALIKN
jgi:hypothetical protein